MDYQSSHHFTILLLCLLCIQQTHIITVLSQNVLKSCDYPYSCYQDAIILNGSGSKIDCWAYESCYQAKALVASGDLAYQLVRCSGSYSCFESDVIVAGGKHIKKDNIGEIICDGYHSCSRANLYIQDYLRCEGSFGCLNSIITYDTLNYNKYDSFPNDLHNISSLKVFCSSNYACAGAILTTIKSVYGWGRFALYEGAIYSNGSDVNVTLNGYRAGYYLSIFCQKSDNCYVTCYGNACTHTYLHCKDTTDTIDTIDSLGSSNCGYNCDFGDYCPYICFQNECTLGSNSQGVIGNGESAGATGRQILDYSVEWSHGSWVNTTDEARDIFDLFTYDAKFCDNSDEDVQAVNCDAYGMYSDCFALNHSVISPNGSICCRGFVSCAYSSTTGAENEAFLDASARIDSSLKVKSNERSHILCDGSSTCEYTNLINTNGFVYCSALDACKRSEIYGNIDAMSGIGERDENGESVYYSDESYLYCDGDASCFEARIYDFNYVRCNAVDSCFYSTIYDSVYIYGAAYDSLHSSIIYSSSNDESNSSNNNKNSNRTMFVYFETSYAGINATVICQRNDECHVYCLTRYSCTNVTVKCLGDMCDVDCDEGEEFGCPTVIHSEPTTTITTEGASTTAAAGVSTTRASETTVEGTVKTIETTVAESEKSSKSKTNESLRTTIEVFALIIAILFICVLSAYIYLCLKRRTKVVWNNVANADIDNDELEDTSDGEEEEDEEDTGDSDGSDDESGTDEEAGAASDGNNKDKDIENRKSTKSKKRKKKKSKRKKTATSNDSTTAGQNGVTPSSTGKTVAHTGGGTTDLPPPPSIVISADNEEQDDIDAGIDEETNQLITSSNSKKNKSGKNKNKNRNGSNRNKNGDMNGGQRKRDGDTYMGISPSATDAADAGFAGAGDTSSSEDGSLPEDRRISVPQTGDDGGI